MEQVKTLFFVYNANSGLYNSVFDGLHKLFSPQTYECKLCAITHGIVGMSDQWRQFVKTYKHNIQYFHKDEWVKLYPHITEYPSSCFPAIFLLSGNEITVLLSAEEINAMQIDELIVQLNTLKI